jgi:hypothetical protein
MTLAAPSPRVRGEGGVRGRRRCLSAASHRWAAMTLPVGSESRRGPLNPSFSPHAGRRSRERHCRVSDMHSRSRDAFAPEVCRPKPPSFCLQKNKGRRSAEKARLSRGASPRSGCCHPSALRAGPRVQRNALAFRRSTAVLASAICRNSIQAALHAMQCAGVTRTLASRLSEAPRAPVVMPAGSMPGPPGSGSDELPPAGTAPTPSVGVTG